MHLKSDSRSTRLQLPPPPSAAAQKHQLCEQVSDAPRPQSRHSSGSRLLLPAPPREHRIPPPRTRETRCSITMKRRNPRFRLTNPTSPLTYQELNEALSDQLMLEGVEMDFDMLGFALPQQTELECCEEEAKVLRGPYREAKIVVEGIPIYLTFEELTQSELYASKPINSSQRTKCIDTYIQRNSFHGDEEDYSNPSPDSAQLPGGQTSSSSSWTDWFRPASTPAAPPTGDRAAPAPQKLTRGGLESISEEPSSGRTNRVPEETSHVSSLISMLTAPVHAFTPVSSTSQDNGAAPKPRPKRKVQREGGSQPTTPIVPTRNIDEERHHETDAWVL